MPIRRLLVSSSSSGMMMMMMMMMMMLMMMVAGLTTTTTTAASSPIPTPRPWPHQFHSLLVENNSGTNEVIDLWYDWPNGRNFNIIRRQLGSLLYDLEWNNGTSFIYTLDEEDQYCRTLYPGVGILRPNWLDGATYLGQRSLDGFLCNVWEKADFITYYEDLLTRRPVYWLFYTGRAVHVMTFEVGAVLEDANWQAPFYCFDQAADQDHSNTTRITLAVASAAA